MAPVGDCTATESASPPMRRSKTWPPSTLTREARSSV